MVKFNRIGNKLGLAGLLGVLLSAGMVVNQMVSDSTVSLDNQRAEGQQPTCVLPARDFVARDLSVVQSVR